MFEFQHGFLMVVQEFQSKSLNHQESLKLVRRRTLEKEQSEKQTGSSQLFLVQRADKEESMEVS